jgi:hypothetical protein
VGTKSIHTVHGGLEILKKNWELALIYCYENNFAMPKNNSNSLLAVIIPRRAKSVLY